MATFLDIGMLGYFVPVMAFLFVLVVVYGIMTFSKIFGGNKALQGIIAFLIAIFVLFTPKLSQVIFMVVPWMTLLFILLLMIFFGFKMFGVTDSDLRLVAMDRSVLWTLLVIIILIVLWSVVQVYGTVNIPRAGSDGVSGDSGQSGGFSSAMGAVLFHPKVLGAVFLLLVAMFAMYLLTGENVRTSDGNQHGGHGGH